MENSKEEIISKIKEKYNNVSFFKRVFSWRPTIDHITELIKTIDMNSEIEKFKEEIENRENHSKELWNVTKESQKSKIDELEEKVNEQLRDIGKMKGARNELQAELDSKTQLTGFLKNKIDESFEKVKGQVNEIHKVFNKTVGNRGKITELHLEGIMEQYFEKSDNFWTKNLSVGSGRVEFAIRQSKDDEKWIPIDSKSIIPKENDKEEWIIDSKYIRRIEKAAKDITQYLGKSNTTDFGIMVIPSNEVLIEMYRLFPDELNIIAEKHAIYVSSPHGFNQYVNTIKTLQDKMNAINSQKESLEKIRVIKGHISLFYNASVESVDKINTAFDKHLKNINKNLEDV